MSYLVDAGRVKDMSTRGRSHDHAVLGALGWQVGRPGSRVRRRGQQGAPAAGAVRLLKELHLQRNATIVTSWSTRNRKLQVLLSPHLVNGAILAVGGDRDQDAVERRAAAGALLVVAVRHGE